jgi:hypothetical protein
MASVFISYRREDSSGYAGRLCDQLTARFGADRVFMDVQDIHPGENFVTSIENRISTCACVVAVIGPHWLESIQSRAQSGDDFVRLELAAALKRQVTVIPVLVGRARMPEAKDLPTELAELSLHNAIEIRDERFADDVAELEKALAPQIGGKVIGGNVVGGNVMGVKENAGVGMAAWSTGRRPLAIALLVIACAIVGYLWLRPAARSAAGAPAVAVPAIDGDWVAEMHKSGQPPFRIRLSFQRVGDSIGGVVHYPTGDGPMHDVTLKGRTLTFSTSHVPQFESTPATITFQAEVTADTIRLMATDDAGVSTGTATRPAVP